MPTRAAHDPPRAPATDLQDVPVEALKNVGAHAAAAMHARGIRTAGDLLALLPRRYLDLRHADDWRRVRHGTPGTLVAVEGVIADLRRSGPPRARRLSIALKEPHGPTTLRAVFFHANAGLNARLALGGTVRLVGALREGRSGPELVQPRVLGSDARTRPIEPVHPGVGAVAPGNVSRVILAALDEVSRWSDPVPPDVASAMNLPSAADALRMIHAPGPSVTPDALRALAEGRSAAHRRLGFEELLALSVAMERTRRSAGGAAPFASTSAVSDDVGKRLGLDLTASQRRAIDTLRGDLARAEPMRRLLVGDVGSGKTAVALAATLAVLRAGGAVAWLCPTTLVAEQHAKTLERGLAGEGGPLAVLVGSTASRAKKRAVEVISQGLVRAVVGTHALLEPGALPPRLGLVVIDEQHRFGVAQRIAMVEGRSPSPHMLVVSATPIPRTLALARHGDLDVVTLDERPAGRQPVVTKVATMEEREVIARTIRRALEAGGRVFVVVPRIDGGESAEEGAARTGIAEAEALLREVVPEDRIVVVHGRMGADAQREALDAFRRGSHPVLLGTTVVEVGLDVREANLMVVLGAEHFGVAQLHQLRGRVGRGGQRAGCLLVAEEAEAEGRARLDDVAGNDDGFSLAEMDLTRRGAGEWFGERQSGGDGVLRFVDPIAAPELVSAAREAARAIVEADPTLARHPALARAVRRVIERGAAPVGEEAG